jgi:hypothetical protein
MPAIEIVVVWSVGFGSSCAVRNGVPQRAQKWLSPGFW